MATTYNARTILNSSGWIKDNSSAINYGSSIGVLRQGKTTPEKIIDLTRKLSTL